MGYGNIGNLIGKTLAGITQNDSDIIFTTIDNEEYRMDHDQCCCESVYVDDIVGDISDLVGSPILEAYEQDGDLDAKSDYDESYTWTFYRIRTIKGTVTIKWYGTSNGYYSTSVRFSKTRNKDGKSIGRYDRENN